MAQIDPRGRMELIEAGEKPGTGVCVDFCRLDVRGVATQPLVRACGPRGRLIDATAGLGGDAWILAAAGFAVTCIERSTPVATVLDDGISRALNDDSLRKIAQRIGLIVGSSRDLLMTTVPPDARPTSTVYLDPMYPPKEGSALAPKSIRLVRAAVGDDHDANILLESARGAGFGRVVVKRPLSAAPLSPGVHHAVEGKLARFDVYQDARV